MEHDIDRGAIEDRLGFSDSNDMIVRVADQPDPHRPTSPLTQACRR
jgi:hypothetical protein